MDEKERIFQAYADTVLNEKEEEKVDESFKTKKVPQSRIRKVMEKAQDAFWKVVAKEFKEVKYGDMDPMQVLQVEDAMTNAINLWLENNYEV